MVHVTPAADLRPQTAPMWLWAARRTSRLVHSKYSPLLRMRTPFEKDPGKTWAQKWSETEKMQVFDLTNVHLSK